MNATPLRGAAVLALLAGFALPGAAEQDPVTLVLTCKAPNPKARRPALLLEGQAPLPNGLVLQVTLTQHFETWTNGKLKSQAASAGGFVARMENRRFAKDGTVRGPGIFGVKVDILEDLQNEAVLKAAKAVTPKAWSFVFHAFGEDLLAQLEPNLRDLEELATEAQGILKDFLDATKEETGWKAAQAQLEPRIKKFRYKAQDSELSALYPAALNEIHYTIQNIHQNLPYLQFKDGKFAGAKDYHAGDNQVKTHRGEDFASQSFKRYLEEAPGIAARELCLWILHDVRRAGQLRPEAAELIKSVSKRGGVAEFAERLAALKPEEVDALEKDLRGSKVEEAPKNEKAK